MLVLDEAHKLRNLYGANQSPQVAQQFREVLANRMFKYVLMLTATPIQNRLWDIYSLVDLLAVARGHQNPFGTEGIFARTFIADNRTDARQSKPHVARLARIPPRSCDQSSPYRGCRQGDPGDTSAFERGGHASVLH